MRPVVPGVLSPPGRVVLAGWMGDGGGILREASGVGLFLRKRRVCGAGPLGDRSLPRRSSGDSRGLPLPEAERFLLGETGWRGGFFRTTRRERGAGQDEAAA